MKMSTANGRAKRKLLLCNGQAVRKLKMVFNFFYFFDGSDSNI